jgi:hypothetical protein
MYCNYDLCNSAVFAGSNEWKVSLFSRFSVHLNYCTDHYLMVNVKKLSTGQLYKVRGHDDVFAD